jgi:hypothetical protein
MNETDDISAGVARALERTSLPSPVIGGHVVNAYGYFYTTVDLDFMACIEDLPAWREIFEALGYQRIGQFQPMPRP